MFVDRAETSLGAPVVDLVGMLPSVRLQGGPDPHRILARHPLARDPPPNQLAAVAAGVAGYFVERSMRPAPPGLPTVRRFQRDQGRLAVRLLRERLS